MSQEIQYPTRCKIIDVSGLNHKIGPYTAKTPDESKPHVDKEGIAEKINGTVRITLDDGNVIYGNECWWAPLKD